MSATHGRELPPKQGLAFARLLKRARPCAESFWARRNWPAKLKDYAEHHNNPDRLLYAMKRVGPEGSGQFQRITYDEALAEIKKRWTQILDQHRPQADGRPGSVAICPKVSTIRQIFLNILFDI
jgi:anaerobic selenocysteine-containing dehydrogenase